MPIALAAQPPTLDKPVDRATQIAPISVQIFGQQLGRGPSLAGLGVEVFRDQHHRDGERQPALFPVGGDSG
jgi:hypothetical protein